MLKVITATAVALVVAFAAPVIAAPKVSQKTKTYPVSATTAAGLVQEMNQRGPNGYWAYTAWNVKWTGTCKLTVDVVYTLPKHSKPAAMSADVRKKFDSMLAALTKHEQDHGQHGILAAQEIESAGCKGGDAIIKKYNKADVDFDKRTDHGRKQGVVLK